VFSGVSDFTRGRDACFEAKGSVIYSRPNVGFGLAFLEVEPRFLPVLQKWLRSAKEKIESGYDENPIDGRNEKE
jgi:hypothetical protein